MAGFIACLAAIFIVGCSVENLDASCHYATAPRTILNGTPDSTCTFSPALKLQIEGSRAGADCSGVLVKPDTVLTAAHCISDPRLGRVRGLIVRAGSELIAARKWIAHPAYRAGSEAEGAYAYDVAVIFLSDAIAGTTPVPLARQDPPAGANVTAVGFGFDGSGDGNGRLGRRLVGALRVLDNRISTYRAGITAIGPQQTCEGDSGGPLLRNGVLVGILSGGEVANEGAACADSLSSVYSSVATLRPWIESTIAANAGSALRIGARATSPKSR